MHSSRMRTVCNSSHLLGGLHTQPRCRHAQEQFTPLEQAPPWEQAPPLGAGTPWIRHPPGQIPLNLPLGCGPGPDPPQLPSCVWAWTPQADPLKLPPWMWAWKPARDAGIPHPHPETCCKACWDTTCNACWGSTPPL